MRIVKGVYFNSKGEITKIQFFIIFLLSFMVLLVLVSFFSLRDNEDNESDGENKVVDVSTLVKYPVLFYVFGSERDLTKCNVHNRQNALTSCRIISNVYANKTDFCKDGLTKDDEKELFVYSSLGNDSLEVSARDYCWILMSETTKIDYCGNVKDANAKKLCIFRRNL